MKELSLERQLFARRGSVSYNQYNLDGTILAMFGKNADLLKGKVQTPSVILVVEIT
jgi:hypothetical protein